MAKDPAVLFYTKDWLEGTVDMFPEEKGVYIDLLCYQHQKGFLPKDTRRLARITGLSEEAFQKVWNQIKSKFVGIDILSASLSDSLSEWKSSADHLSIRDGLVNIRMLKETISRKKVNSKKSIQAYVTNWFRYDKEGKRIEKITKQKILKAVDYPKLLKENAGKKEVYHHLHQLAKRDAKQSQYANGDVNANVIVSINENGSENEFVIDSPFDRITYENFVDRLCRYFSQNGSSRQGKVISFLEDLKKKGCLAEFRSQSEAYMNYKTFSGEKIHGWQGYTTGWEASDWTQKLQQYLEGEKPKKTFSTNR